MWNITYSFQVVCRKILSFISIPFCYHSDSNNFYSGLTMTDPLDTMWARWAHIQSSLFPWLREEIESMTALLGRLITILDVIGLEAFVRACSKLLAFTKP